MACLRDGPSVFTSALIVAVVAVDGLAPFVEGVSLNGELFFVVLATWPRGMARLRTTPLACTSAWIVVIFVACDGLLPFFFFLCDDIGDIGIVDIVDGRALFFVFGSFFLGSTFVLMDTAFAFSLE